MKIKKYFLVSITATFMTLFMACEGYQCAVGTIYDSSNNLPLDSVLCVSNGGDEILTDSTGSFDLCGPFGGCMPDCPEVEVEFSKEGYVSQKKTDDFKSVYLEKE
jgi:hypothetical protein